MITEKMITEKAKELNINLNDLYARKYIRALLKIPKIIEPRADNSYQHEPEIKEE